MSAPSTAAALLPSPTPSPSALSWPHHRNQPHAIQGPGPAFALTWRTRPTRSRPPAPQAGSKQGNFPSRTLLVPQLSAAISLPSSNRGLYHLTLTLRSARTPMNIQTGHKRPFLPPVESCSQYFLTCMEQPLPRFPFGPPASFPFQKNCFHLFTDTPTVSAWKISPH